MQHHDILALLGHSIAYDEWKGDFEQARHFAELWLAEARQIGAANAVADALIWRSIVHILQGEPLEALGCLDEAEQPALNDADRSLLVASYRWLATLERFYTSFDGSGVTSGETLSLWDSVGEVTQLSDCWNALRERATDRQTLFRASFVRFLCILTSSREVLNNAPSPLPVEGFLKSCIEQQATAEQSGELGAAGYAEWCAADLCSRGRDTENATKYLQQARITYARANDKTGIALCLLKYGDWQCAPSSTPLAWNLAYRENTEDAFTKSSLWAGIRVPEANAIANARVSYEEAEQLFRDTDASRGLAVIRLRYGYLAMLAEDFVSAIRFADEARDSFKLCGDWRGYWLAQTHLIMSQIGATQPADVASLAQEISQWSARHGSFSFSLSLAFLVNDFSRDWLNRKGDIERALASYRAAQALYEAVGATVKAAQCVVDQGIVYDAVGERATALTYFEHAIDLYSEDLATRPQIAGQARGPIILLALNVFNLYFGQMNADGMERSLIRLKALAAKLFGVVENRISTTLFPEVLGETSGRMHPVALALARLKRGSTQSTVPDEKPQDPMLSFLPQVIPEYREIVSVLSPLYRSRRARDLGDDAAAERFLAEAAAALRKVSAPERFRLEAGLLAEEKKFDRAAAAFRNYLQHTVLDDRSTEAENRDDEKPSGLLVQQVKRQQRELAFITLVRLKAYAEAKVHFEALRRMYGEEWWASTNKKPWELIMDCGEMYEGLAELASAGAYYDQAIVQLQTRRSLLRRNELKTTLAADKGVQYLYFQAARVAFKQGDYTGAFDYAERGKARGLLDLMAGGLAFAHLPDSGSAVLRSWRQLNAQLTLWRGLLAQERGLLAQERGNEQPSFDRAELTERIKGDEERLVAVEAELAQSQPALREAIGGEAKTLSLQQVSAALLPGVLLVEYFFVGEDLLAWAINHEGLARKIILSLDARALGRDIRAYHEACAAHTPTDALSAKLADTFLVPFADEIRASSHLIIVPYGSAHTLPFHALRFDGEPLCATRTVSYLPNASTLQFLRLEKAPLRIDRILAVGNPTGDLPAAATEAAYVASLFGRQALIGDSATKKAVREQIVDTPLLHFATHGRLAEQAPLLSSIALANGDKLTVYELMGMQLDADLVVLSACDSGRGEVTGGDDVLGLTRGLLGAGARSAIVSLWPVNDFSTSLLMGELYRGMLLGATPAAALARAQQYLRELNVSEIEIEVARLRELVDEKETASVECFERWEGASNARGTFTDKWTISSDFRPFSHPYHWAAFMLIGVK